MAGEGNRQDKTQGRPTALHVWGQLADTVRQKEPELAREQVGHRMKQELYLRVLVQVASFLPQQPTGGFKVKASDILGAEGKGLVLTLEGEWFTFHATDSKQFCDQCGWYHTPEQGHGTVTRGNKTGN